MRGELLGEKGITVSAAVTISIILTAIIVGGVVYVVTPKEERVPGEVTESDVRDFLSGASSSTVKDILSDVVDPDIIAELAPPPGPGDVELTLGFVLGGYISGSTWDGRFIVAAERLKTLYPWFDYVYDEGVVLGGKDPAVSARDLIETMGADLVDSSWEPGGIPAFHTLSTEYPDLYFFDTVASDVSSGRNFSRYFVRQYQAMYLEGLVAGALTETNKIGIAVGPACVQNYRRMAAFYLGIKEANPDATLYVKYVGEWYAPAKERDVSLALVDLGVDVLTNYTDSTAPVEVCAERGIWYIGKDTDVASIGDADLKMDIIGDTPWATTDVVAVSFDTRWEVIWNYYLKEYLAGVENPARLVFLGMDDYISLPADHPFLPEGTMLLAVDLQNGGRIGVDAISPEADVSSEVKELIEKRRAQMIAGVWDPFFEYELVSSGEGVEIPELELTVPPEGTVVKPARTPASDEFLLAKLNFQLEGIVKVE